MQSVKDQFGKDARRGYHDLTNAWYRKELGDKTHEIMFGIYHDEDGKGNGGTSGEIEMEWEELGKKVVPQMSAYDDSWKVLYSFQDVMAELAKVDSENITPEVFCKILDSCGFINLTKYTQD